MCCLLCVASQHISCKAARFGLTGTKAVNQPCRCEVRVEPPYQGEGPHKDLLGEGGVRLGRRVGEGREGGGSLPVGVEAKKATRQVRRRVKGEHPTKKAKNSEGVAELVGVG